VDRNRKRVIGDRKGKKTKYNMVGKLANAGETLGKQLIIQLNTNTREE